MKKVFSLILLTATLFFFGCTTTTLPNEEAPVPLETYENKLNNFSLEFPSTWTFEENVFSSLVVFTPPLGEDDVLKENVGIVIKPLKIAYTLDEYQQIIEPQLQSIMTNFEKISDENIQINGIDTKKIIYKGEQQGYKLQWQQVYFIYNNNAYIITYTASQDTFDEFITEANSLISTLDIK